MGKGYDLVGDVHGRYTALEELVSDLGYRIRADGAFEHKDGDRQLIFVGDTVNKGPDNRAVVDALRASQQAGTAEVILGNHEFFNICYARQDADGQFIAPHNEKSERFLRTFLTEFPFGSQAHSDVVDWMESLPVYIQKGDLAVAHAMHGQQDMMTLQSSLDFRNALTPNAFDRYAAGKNDHLRHVDSDQSDFYMAMERLLYGVSVRSPDDLVEQGYTKRLRLNWWEGANANPVRLLGLESAKLDQELVTDLSAKLRRLKMDEGHALNVPDQLLAFGHYCLPQAPHVVSEKALCLDFNGEDGQHVLTGYRFNEGDDAFYDEQMVHVDAPFEDDGPDI